MALKPHSFWSWKIRKVLWGEDASVIQLFFNLQVIKNIYLVTVLKVCHVQMMNCTSSCGRTQSHRDLNFICYNFVVEPHFNLTCKADSTSQKNKYHGFRGLLLKTPDIMEHARKYWHTVVSWMLLWKAEKADLMQSIVRYILSDNNMKKIQNTVQQNWSTFRFSPPARPLLPGRLVIW